MFVAVALIQGLLIGQSLDGIRNPTWIESGVLLPWSPVRCPFKFSPPNSWTSAIKGKNFGRMKTMYADDIVSVEADGREVKGKEAVIQKSVAWAGANEIHGGKCVGPYLSAQNAEEGQFAGTFHFEMTPKVKGKMSPAPARVQRPRTACGVSSFFP
jgi:hypothetical protein